MIADKDLPDSAFWTVVNFTPFQYVEDKPLVPFQFIIPPATDNDRVPGILHVKDAYSKLYMPLQQHPFNVPVSKEALAKDLVESLLNGLIEREAGVAEPCLFAVAGRVSANDVRLRYKDKIEAGMQAQTTWCLKLVKKADDDWQRLRQHKVITDMQRWACKKLGYKREWSEVSAATPLELVPCRFCGTNVITGIAVCPNCKNVIDVQLYAQLTQKASA